MSTFHKQCPECGSKIHVRKLKCVCGHSFSRKSKLIQKSENALISQQKQKTTIVACQARKRAIETSVESERHRQVDSACHAKRRALESQVESERRGQVDSACHQFLVWMS